MNFHRLRSGLKGSLKPHMQLQQAHIIHNDNSGITFINVLSLLPLALFSTLEELLVVTHITCAIVRQYVKLVGTILSDKIG